jgi:hypothetical protein
METEASEMLDFWTDIEVCCPIRETVSVQVLWCSAWLLTIYIRVKWPCIHCNISLPPFNIHLLRQPQASLLYTQQMLCYGSTVWDIVHCLRLYLICTAFWELVVLLSPGNWLSLYWQIVHYHIFFFNISKQVCPCSIQAKVAFLVNISMYSSYDCKEGIHTYITLHSRDPKLVKWL